MEPSLPVLVVGDVHGDLEQLFKGLDPYPPDRWHTIFLGDLVDGGMFGVGALRYARDRPNSTVLLGNHEIALMWALRDRAAVPLWHGIGGQLHDLEELRGDPGLREWMLNLPAMVRLPDGTLVQHSDNDGYGRLLDPPATEPVTDINVAVSTRLREGEEEDLWSMMTPRAVFRSQPRRLVTWLDRMGATRLVHGHTPHRGSEPDVYAQGLAICYDGGLSRARTSRWGHHRPPAASIGPLPDAPGNRIGILDMI